MQQILFLDFLAVYIFLAIFIERVINNILESGLRIFWKTSIVQLKVLEASSQTIQVK